MVPNATGFEVEKRSKIFIPRTYMQTHTPTIVQSFRYFEKFLPLIDSVLCRLQDDVNIMGYVRRYWGPVASHNMVELFTFFAFPLYFSFFPRNFNVFSENTLFNSLSCKRFLNTSLCCFTTTSGLEYGPESLKYYKINLKF